MKTYRLTISKNLYSCLIIVLLSSGTLFGQSLEKGSLVGIHTVTVKLDPDVTMNQYKNFILTKWIPAFEKNVPEMKVYLLQAKRGVNENSLGFMFIFKSNEDRNKYWNADNTPTTLQQAANEKKQAITEEGNKLGTWTSVYTDWVIQ